MRLEKRNHTSPAAYLLAPVGAVVFTLLVSALLVLWAGAPVGSTYALLLQGAFGSVFALTETLTRATPHLRAPYESHQRPYGAIQHSPACLLRSLLDRV